MNHRISGTTFIHSTDGRDRLELQWSAEHRLDRDGDVVLSEWDALLCLGPERVSLKASEDIWRTRPEAIDVFERLLRQVDRAHLRESVESAPGFTAGTETLTFSQNPGSPTIQVTLGRETASFRPPHLERWAESVLTTLEEFFQPRRRR